MTTVVDKLVPIRAIFSHLDDMKIKIKIHTLSFMSNLIWVIIFSPKKFWISFAMDAMHDFRF